MKVLLVAEKDSTHDNLIRHLSPQGFDFIAYRNPLKAMDNIEEIAPHVVIFSAEDFPRHWKPFLCLLRVNFPRETSAFVLLKGELFSFDEAAKATHLGVSGIVEEQFENRRVIAKLEEIITRYQTVSDDRGEERYFPSDADQVTLIFNHPIRNTVITGQVQDISIGGASFIPDDPSSTEDLEIDTMLSLCTLGVGGSTLSFESKVIRSGMNLGLHFENLTEEGESLLKDYIDRKAERELRHILRSQG